MKEFINDEFKSLLTAEGMADFESLWDRDDPWFEKPNKGRSKNGWSGVCRIEIGGKNFFLKKQENFIVYSVSKPLGVSLVEREFQNLKAFEELKIPAMNVVYYGVRKYEGDLQGMILTESLDNYLALDESWKDIKSEENTVNQRRRIACAVGDLLNVTHTKGMMHHGLYPKHIFIHKSLGENEAFTEPECRLIDLEKARKAAFHSKKQIRDIDKLNRYCSFAAKTDRLAFLLRYLGEDSCNSSVRNFLAKLQKVSRD